MTPELERIIVRDVALCEAMSDEIKDYLRSTELFWEPNRRRPGGADLPKLTIGGLLLATRRLETLHDHLKPDPAQALTRAGRELTHQKSHWRLRYQNKLARDLRSRLDAWAWYLDDCQKQDKSAIIHYPRQVETRVKIDLLLDEAEEIGLEVKKSHRRKTGLDERLRTLFAKGGFCWISELAAGFPPDRFWYLYGSPQSG
jgi:hypothetical protein